MSEYKVADFGCVTNATVYGFDESIRRAKFPMSTDVNALTCNLTNGIISLAQSKAGEGHDNYIMGIVVQFDLSFQTKKLQLCSLI